MSTHPNAILAVALTPDNLSRKTMRNILDEHGVKGPDEDIKIGSCSYHYEVMEGNYNESWQISAKEGDLIFFDLVTHGNGETVSWVALETQKAELEKWSKSVCERHHCSYEIFVTANYW